MQNLSFSRPSPVGDVFVVNHGYHVLNDRPDGSSSLDKVEDPYDGLLGESFSLDSQLSAGVPLSKVGKLSTGSLSEVDRCNSNASAFLNEINTNRSKS